MVTKASKAVVSASGSAVAEYIPGAEDWDVAVQTSDVIAGHDLAKDEMLDALVNIPFMITRVVFRKGIVKNGKTAAFASVECVIAPEHVLKRRRVNMMDLPFEPLSQVVFNDGSTGIYRQIVAYLAAGERIVIPETLPESGGYGESRYDLPPVEWTEIRDGEVTAHDDGWIDYAVNVRLTCPRGLRLSQYENDFNPGGSTTRYIA